MYKCNYCNYTSDKKHNLNLHCNIKHIDIKDIEYNDKCNKCNKIFSTKSNLSRHQKNCKGIVNPTQCQKCNKFFSTATSKCRHFKICKTEIKKEDSINPTIINNITNNTTINNITNNTYIFQSNQNVHPIAYQNYSIQELSNNVIIPNRNNLKIMMENFGRLIYKDVKNKNIKKTSNKNKYCLVKTDYGEWCNRLDKDIIPKATKDIAYNFRIIIDNNEVELCNINMKNRCIIPKLTEFLSIIIDYNHELEILNDIDMEDNKIFNDMKDRTICIIIDSSRC